MVRNNNRRNVDSGAVATEEVVLQVTGNMKGSRNATTTGSPAAATLSASPDNVNAPWGRLVQAADADARTALATELAAILKNESTDVISSFLAGLDFSTKGPARLAALAAVTAVAEVVGLAAEPFLVELLPQVLETASSKARPESLLAVSAATAVVSIMSKHASQHGFPMLFEAIDPSKGWQTRVLAFNLIESRALAHRVQHATRLPDLIPQLTEHLWDTKAQVKEACRSAMTKSLEVVDNVDINPVIQPLASALINPSEVVEFIHRVAATTFVRSVTSPTLAILVPTLLRGLNERQTAVKRQTAKIIHNMSKLVDNAPDAAPFLPLLLPALEKSTESVSNPEARAVCEAAHEQLVNLNAKVEALAAVPKEVDHAVLVGLLTTEGVPAAFVDYAALLCASLIEEKEFDVLEWTETVGPYLGMFIPRESADAKLGTVLEECLNLLGVKDEEEEDDDAEELCNCRFTLAYGSKVLLHNTQMQLKRGYRYGLLGGNDSGKTTLMRAIANGQVEGFPPATEVRTVFVEADIQGELSDLSCIDYIMADHRIQNAGLSREDVSPVMLSVGFTQVMQGNGVSTLSGGWRMKLAMARAMLQRADILLLDEPTNHLDVINVQWVKNYLLSLTNVTSIIVSHDSGLLDDVCTHILQIDSLKLGLHKGNLSKFVEKVPSAKAYFELASSKLTFRFPQPGALPGVKSKGRALMKMDDCTFTYPINDKPTISNITVQVSLSSRVACVGVNGAGKSTMIKLLTGELVPQSGVVWKHPNARVAYVAQHAFHHIEKHLNKTPNEYIRWRYANDEDKEALTKETMKVSDEEMALQKTPIEWIIKDEDTGKTTKSMRIIDKLTGARQESRQKTFEYEVKWQGMDLIHNEFVPLSKLSKMGFQKQINLLDAKIAARAGMYIRPLTSNNVEAHLEDVGLDREFGTHHRMSALSGGQKVKVVLAAAMWNQPHILILDEPTNYLDRESLGALASAIREFEGGVVMITHNNQFCSALCPETWVLENGKLDCQGDPEWMENAANQAVNLEVVEEMVDGAGNKVAVVQKKELTRREKKMRAKRRKEKLKAGEELNSSDESTIE